MSDIRKKLQSINFDKFDFVEHQQETKSHSKHYKILIVDDDEEVHHITKMVLDGFEFEGTGIELLQAYSFNDTIETFNQHSDIAVMLLDVVMEEDNTGLQIVKYIRDQLKNKLVRIILRTGQPGKAPEDKVIINYDINDYKSKTELTVQRLYTSLYAALRSYRDIYTIERNKLGLEKVIQSTTDLLKFNSFDGFAQGILMQLASLLNINEDSMYIVERQDNGFLALDNLGECTIISATGAFTPYIGKSIKELNDSRVENILSNLEENQIIFNEHLCAGNHTSINNVKNYVFMEGPLSISEMDQRLVRIILNNFSLIFDNYLLNEDITSTQGEIINVLSEVVENRSEETANHITRVSEICHIIGTKYGLAAEETRILKLISPLHDVGKIAIPDSILKKPDKLTVDEFEVMKRHTTIGYNILIASNKPLFKQAAIIAQNHHERWDGMGYPIGLSGENIPLHARIVAVADVFDALLHKRVYKDPWDINSVIELFEEERGKQFDPALVDILLGNIDEIYHVVQKYTDR
ncbi:MAG: DUF3369 domain-containing protein [Clostridia bacterium]|nr:DUF3369 domain-containing protein [Clostridia bacterium]